MEDLVSDRGRSGPARASAIGGPAAGESAYDFGIVGGGILGLSTAVALTDRHPGARAVLLEKEAGCGRHQTGHNSGVIHSGIYYRPGSLKARFAVDGNRELVRFCREHGIRHAVCGKVIVATAEEELPRLALLQRRAEQNGIDVRRIGPARLEEIEPHATGLAGLEVPSTGIVDYGEVAAVLATIFRERGGAIRTGVELKKVAGRRDALALETTAGAFLVRFLINCGGLQSDRIARLTGARPPAKIVPFRGEYYDLRPAARHLVRGLIYPVPDPAFPFLGVHFTRAIDGSVHAGPNAVLSLAREGYRKFDVEPRDALEALSYPGLWRLAATHWRAGCRELARSVSKRLFVRSLQRLVPAVRSGDIRPGGAGVRAQALDRRGRLLDDFLIVAAERSIHVCNAPSPAATACLPIGRSVVERIPAEYAVGGRAA